jgi:hypothetical protein
VASGGNLLWVIEWRVVVICYGLFSGEWWQYIGYCAAIGGNFFMGCCVASVGNLLLVIVR